MTTVTPAFPEPPADQPRQLPPFFGFDEVICGLKFGLRFARAGWNGKGMFIYLVPGSTFTIDADRPLGRALPDHVGQPVHYREHIDMFTAQGDAVAWVASQSDLLATDWVRV